uniref:Uncharacterized protein n=1 Tax=Myripristis murdjan TaxID=586833 RepID=A0A667ZGI5_9TELE
MADEEAEQDRSSESGVAATVGALRRRLQDLQEVLVRDSSGSPVQPSSQYCQEFCRVRCVPLGVHQTG